MANVLHVAVTDAEAGGRLRPPRQGARTSTSSRSSCRTSYADLEAKAKEVRARTDALGKIARSYLGIDVNRNAVVLALTSSQLPAYEGAAKEAGITIVPRQVLKTQYDAGCTSRSACDWTIRGGSMIWQGSQGNNNCSVGFTARTSSNTRYHLHGRPLLERQRDHVGHRRPVHRPDGLLPQQRPGRCVGDPRRQPVVPVRLGRRDVQPVHGRQVRRRELRRADR